MSSSAQAIHASVYPRLPTPLDPATVELLFSPRVPELEWVQSITHAGDTQVWLLTLLKGFEVLGYFPALDDIPDAVLRHVAIQCGAKVPSTRAVERRTLYRHHQRIRLYLDVSPWRGQGRHLIETTMEKVARVRSNPADLINAAIECLVIARIELPALSTLRRVAGNVNERVQSEQIGEVHAQLTPSQCEALDALLVVKDASSSSQFDQLCQSTGSVSRKNVKHLIERLNLLESLSNATVLLASISALKVRQWADEAQRMTVSELRAYRLARRRVLLLCLIHVKRSNSLDDLATVFLKSVQTLKHRAKSSLQDWLSARHRTREQLLMVFSDVLQRCGTRR